MLATSDLLKEAVFVTLQVCGPVVLSTLVIGIIISLLQTLTQIQEPGLLFVSKFVVTLICLFGFSSFMTNHLMNFTQSIFDRVTEIK